MEKAKVYYCDMHTGRMNLPEKLKFLMKKAGFEEIDFKNKYTAIKVHFGEPGNLAFLRPNYAKAVADYVKELGGKAFVTDCNTLYVGGRKNALDHLDSAYSNGYNPFQTGVHTIIADGLKGTDEEIVPINGEYVKEAKIGQAIMDADIIISLNHFKCTVLANLSLSKISALAVDNVLKFVLITGQVLLITKPLSIMINVLDAVAVLESVLKMQSLPAWMKLMTF